MFCTYFISVACLFIHPERHSVVCRTDGVCSDEVQAISRLFHGSQLCLIQSLHQAQGHPDSLCAISQKFYSFTFYISSVMHFELIFVKGGRSVSRLIFCLWTSSCVFVEKTVLIPSHCLCCFFTLQLGVFVGIYFWPPEQC